MCTGVQSSVILPAMPSPDVWEAFTARSDRVVTLIDLCDGRVHVACFEPVSNNHPDLRTALRDLSATVRVDLESLRA
jgi:hypothetical protein